MINTIGGKYVAYMYVKESDTYLTMFSDDHNELMVNWATRVAVFEADGLTGARIAEVRAGRPVGHEVYDFLASNKAFVCGERFREPEPPAIKCISDMLDAIREKKISYGIDMDYFIALDPDGFLVLLKKDLGPDNEHQRNLDSENEERHWWPENHYDGLTVLRVPTNFHKGLAITEDFLNALNIAHL